MNGSHIAGGGLGALLGVALAALGSKIGLNLDDATSASLGVAVAAAGLAFGHAFGKAWAGAGIVPSLSRGFFGPKPAGDPPAFVPAAQDPPAA